MNGLRPTHAVVDLDALGRNFRRLASRAGTAAVMPVVKADAYGHGAAPVARRLEDAGARHLAVAVVEEGSELRRAGVQAEILVMGWIGPAQLPDLLRHGLVANAHSIPMLREIDAFARERRAEVSLHLKADTGMTRLGIRPGDLGEALAILRSSRDRLRLRGLFQNYASADEPASPQTPDQTSVFRDVARAVLAEHPAVEIHVANSAASVAPPPWPADLPHPARVRPGLALFASLPPNGDDLEDVMSFVSVVDQVKDVPAGTRVGYGGAFVAARPSRIAIVPAGYADGIPRSLGETGDVIVAGRRCRIAGRISMDLTAVDVTDLPAAPVRGDEVTFFGRRNGERLGVDEVARKSGTVPWEILCGVGPRVPRVFVEGGRPVRLSSRFLPSGEEAARA